MVDSNECAAFGWDTLARMLGKSKRSCMRLRPELIEAGVIFYTYKVIPTSTKQKFVGFFPSLLKVWLALKTAKSEIT